MWSIDAISCDPENGNLVEAILIPKQCTIKNICGGGHLAHRYSEKNGFDNPSVYCNEIFKLVLHIQNRLIDDMAEFSKGEVKIDKLTMNDHPQFSIQ